MLARCSMSHCSPLPELQRRGLVAQTSGLDELDAHLAGGSRTLYCGFDPTAPSLHIGNLVPLLTLRRFQLAGHRPIALVGGATGLIGDPSFKSGERALNDEAVVAGWVERIREQVSGVLSFEGDNAALVVDNLEWTRNLDTLTFLREIGKHFSVNAMIQKEAVRARLDRDNAGISYTEFSYILLQSMDYKALAERYGCTLQIGGSDQWGNITGGLELVRRTLATPAPALTVPLVTKADGTKFGKTESGSVWLDPSMTSPYAFYQFWVNTADADVMSYIRLFGFLSAERESELAAEHEANPGRRMAQVALAAEVTGLVHGEAGLAAARRITGALFSGDLRTLTSGDLAQLALDGLPSTEITEPAARVGETLVRVGLASSNGNAMQMIKSGAVSVNGAKISTPEATFADTPPLAGNCWLLRRGKRNWALVRIAGR